VALETGPLYWFRDWPNAAVPAVAAGVYTVWRGAEFVYVGMSRRGRTADDLAQRGKGATGGHGLSTRLASHAAGRRSGDQFCVYIADRFVLPSLSADEIDAIATGTLSLDAKVREFIHERLGYRFIVTPDGRTAQGIEKAVREGALRAAKPVLNPR
jgi:hypothetical protein